MGEERLTADGGSIVRPPLGSECIGSMCGGRKILGEGAAAGADYSCARTEAKDSGVRKKERSRGDCGSLLKVPSPVVIVASRIVDSPRHEASIRHKRVMRGCGLSLSLAKGEPMGSRLMT